MTKTPVSTLIIKLSIPTIISMLVTNIYNLADTAFVGQLGNSASGAVGVVFGFMAILQALGFMFGNGSGSIISRMLGNKDTENASKIASTGFFSALTSGVLVSVLSFIFLNPLVMFLGSTTTIAPYAQTYISFILFAAPFMTTSFLMNNILRYEGKATLGMIGLLIGAVLNIIGDPIFMFVLNMGIAGAGLSTALSQVISFSVLLSMFLRGKTVTKFSFKLISRNYKDFLNILATGLPSLLRQGLNSITTVLLNNYAAVYGDEAVAAMSIVSRVIFFTFSIALGVGQGFQPVCGFNYGAKKYGRLRQAFTFTFVLAEIVVVIMAIPLLIFSNGIIGVFRDDLRVIEIGTRTLILQGISQLFLPFCMTCEMLLQSTGKRLYASLLSAVRNGLFFVPSLIVLANLRGLSGIQEAQPLAVALAFIPSVFFAVDFFRKLPRSNA